MSTIKAISLWQPWASLMAWGIKKVETRDWQRSYRGPLLIHASKKWSPLQEEFCQDDLVRALLKPFVKDWRRLDLAFPLGKLVGKVELLEIIPTMLVGTSYTMATKGPELYEDDARPPKPTVVINKVEEKLGDYSPGRFAWVTRAAMWFKYPPPYMGSVGLFDVKTEVVADARAIPAIQDRGVEVGEANLER